jgi:hypothetical protein
VLLSLLGSEDGKFCSENSEQKNKNVTTLQKHINNNTSNTSNICNNVAPSSDSTVTKVLLVDGSIRSIKEEIIGDSLLLKTTVCNQMPLKNLDPDAPTRVRFLKEYRTQIPRPGVSNAYDDKLYHVGEIVNNPAWKVKDLVACGIVEVLA